MIAWREHPAAIFLLLLILPIECLGQTRRSTTQKVVAQELPVEVFQILQLPLLVHEANLVKDDKGYLLRCSLSNSSESKIIGLRYSLVMVDQAGQVRPAASRSEGVAIEPYSNKQPTFQTPIKIKPRQGQRFILMLEQVLSPDSIWEVVKAKDALEAYAAGDYSKVPNVICVSNQIDAPLPQRVIPRLN